MNNDDRIRIYREHKKDQSEKNGLIEEILELGLGAINLFIVPVLCLELSVRFTGRYWPGYPLILIVWIGSVVLKDRIEACWNEKAIAEQKSNEELWDAIFNNDSCLDVDGYPVIDRVDEIAGYDDPYVDDFSIDDIPVEELSVHELFGDTLPERPKYAKVILEIHNNRKVFKCGNCGTSVRRKSYQCPACNCRLTPMSEDVIGDPIFKVFDNETERIIEGLFDYCAGPLLASDSKTVFDITYYGDEETGFKSTDNYALRRWRIQDGIVTLIEPEFEDDDSLSSLYDPFETITSDGTSRNRAIIGFYFDEKNVYIDRNMGPLFGVGYVYDYSFDDKENLILNNEKKRWVS